MTSNLTGHEMPVQGFNGVRKSRFSIGGGGQKSQATMKENKKKLGLSEVKPYSEFFKNTSCEYVL